MTFTTVMTVVLHAWGCFRATSAQTPENKIGVTKTVLQNLPEAANFKLVTFQGKIYAFQCSPDYRSATAADDWTNANVYAYDPAVNCWERRSKMPTARTAFNLAQVNDQVYVLGGCTALNTPRDAVEAYDLTSNTWTTKKPIPTPRNNLGIVVANGKIYTLGGQVNGTETNAFEIYDPVQDIWTVETKLPRKLMGVSAVALGNKIYCLRGVQVVNGNWQYLYDLQTYDLSTRAWTKLAPWSYEREPEEFIVVNDRLFVVGGGAFTDSRVCSLKEYDVASNRWIMKCNMPTANVHTIHFSWTVLDGKIYTFGGGNWVGNGWQASNHAQRYDPTTDTWEVLPSLSEAKIGMEAVAMGNRVFVIGGEKMGLSGQSNQNPCSECVEIYEVRQERKLSIQRQEKQLHLSWEAESITSYTLEACYQLADNHWEPVPGQAWPTQTNQWIGDMSATNRFYRLKITP